MRERWERIVGVFATAFATAAAPVLVRVLWIAGASGAASVAGWFEVERQLAKPPEERSGPGAALAKTFPREYRADETPLWAHVEELRNEGEIGP